MLATAYMVYLVAEENVQALQVAEAKQRRYVGQLATEGQIYFL
jgi:hypothetical protein